MSADGDALFTRALVTVCKSDTPRDGGVAIGALSDWVQEYAAEHPWLALCDHAGTGAVLIVQYAGNDTLTLCVLDPTSNECNGEDVPADKLKTTLTLYLRGYWE
jgi:hypothetical protein